MNLPRKLALDLHCSFLVVRAECRTAAMWCAPTDHRLRVAFSPFSRDCCGRPRPHRPHLRSETGPRPAGGRTGAHCLTLANAWLTRCGKDVTVRQPRGSKRFKVILEAAGNDAIIVMGESHMHDVRRRTLGTLPMKVLPRTDASFLMVKQPTEPDPEMFDESFACE